MKAGLVIYSFVVLSSYLSFVSLRRAYIFFTFKAICVKSLRGGGWYRSRRRSQYIFIGTFWGWGDGSSRGEQYERCNQQEGGGGEVIVRIFLTNSRLLVDATWKHSATYYSMLECFYFCPELPLGNHSAQCTSFWLGFWPPLDFSYTNNNFPLNKKKIDIFSQSFKSSSTILLPGTSPCDCT